MPKKKEIPEENFAIFNVLEHVGAERPDVLVHIKTFNDENDQNLQNLMKFRINDENPLHVSGQKNQNLVPKEISAP